MRLLVHILISNHIIKKGRNGKHLYMVFVFLAFRLVYFVSLCVLTMDAKDLRYVLLTLILQSYVCEVARNGMGEIYWSHKKAKTASGLSKALVITSR